jgi:hypothetical protein
VINLFTSGLFMSVPSFAFCLFLGLFVVKGPEKWWLLAATILSILLPGQKPGILNEFLF